MIVDGGLSSQAVSRLANSSDGNTHHSRYLIPSFTPCSIFRSFFLSYYPTVLHAFKGLYGFIQRFFLILLTPSLISCNKWSWIKCLFIYCIMLQFDQEYAGQAGQCDADHLPPPGRLRHTSPTQLWRSVPSS